MGQYMVWFTLQFKAWARRKSSWMQVLGMLLLLFMISRIRLPGVETTRIGVCAAPDAFSQRILECLKARESIFEFAEYHNQEEMRQDIVAGRMECGFIFFEGDVGQKNSVSYICTPFSAKGLAAQETFYAAFFEVYSEQILIGSEEEIFGTQSGEITRELLERKYAYQQENEMFRMEVAEIEQETAQEAFTGRASGSVRPVQGAAGLFLFAVLWMAQGRKFSHHGRGAAAALERKQKWKFAYLGCLAEAAVPAAVGTVFIVLNPGHRTVLAELGSMLLFVLVTSIWVLAVGSFFKNSVTFAAWTLAILLVQLAVCPVFIDLSSFIPAAGIVRRAFPLGWLY